MLRFECSAFVAERQGRSRGRNSGGTACEDDAGEAHERAARGGCFLTGQNVRGARESLL